MSASTSLGRSLGACAVLLLLCACEQGEGGVCQGSRDCEDGLLCDLTLDETRGVCRAPEDIDAGQAPGALPDEPDPTPDPTFDASIDSGADDGGGVIPPSSDAGDAGDAGDASSDGDGG
jgi:hypothetical protein